MEIIKTKGIAATSLFKYLLIGYLFSLGLIIFIFAILSLFGAHVISYNNVYYTGVKGLIIGLIMIPVFSVIFAVINWICIGFGTWLWSRFKSIEIREKQ